MRPSEHEGRALFRGLNGGRGGRDPEAVARNQRGRLMGAMVEAVWRHGYAATTVAELVALAGVSKSTFYAHFQGKEECFLATFDAAVDALRERMDEARAGDGAPATGRLETALEVLGDGAVEQPRVAKLMTVESYAPGAAAVPHRNRFLGFLEEAVAEALGAERRDGDRPDPTARAVAAGICHAAYACVRDERPGGLAEGRGDLLEWALSYRDAGPAPGVPVEPPESTPPGRGEPSRRDAIARAALDVAAERGYAALTIPLISARAAISNQTFYEHFPSKQDAFLAGFSLVVEEVRETASAAYGRAGGGEEGVAAATWVLLERISRDELLASVALFELPALGAEVLDRRGLIRNCLGVLLPRGDRGAQGPSPLVVEAIVGGIATVVQLELAAGRAAGLTDLAPALARVALVPFRSAPLSA